LSAYTSDVDESSLPHEARQRGISGRVLGGPKYDQLSYGVYVHRGAAASLPVRCRAIQRVLPAAAVWSHYTAAALRGWSLPWLPPGLPTFASLPGRGTHLYRQGTYVTRTDEATVEPEMRAGLRLASAPSILAQLAQDLSLVDLIAVMDSALCRGDTTVKELESSLRPHQWGGPMLRLALRMLTIERSRGGRRRCDCCTDGPASTFARSTRSVTTGETWSRAATSGSRRDSTPP
jgi:hypothetical protein